MKALEHLKTINQHKKMVMIHCFKAGLYKQGLLHDLSKYTPVEFLTGVRYYQGYRSPNSAEREAIGLSQAWLHHKGRNKHHMEYWIDYKVGKDKTMCGMKMPTRYIVEMFCDRVAACKIYDKEKYYDGSAWDYYAKNNSCYLIEEQTKKKLEKLLLMLKNEGEDKTFAWIRSRRFKR